MLANNENIKKQYQDKLGEIFGDPPPRNGEDLIEFSSDIVMKVMITSVKVVDAMTAKATRRSEIRHYRDDWLVEYMIAKIKLIMISKLKSVFSRPEIITRASPARRSIIITQLLGNERNLFMAGRNVVRAFMMQLGLNIGCLSRIEQI